MRPAWYICAYLTFIFLGGALIAPWLYKLCQAAASALPAFEFLARQPFHRYVHRSFMAMGALGLWPFLRSVGFRSWRGFGLGGHRHAVHQTAQGLLLGFASVFCAALAVLAVRGRTWSSGHSGNVIAGHLLKATLAAVIVAFIEELFFRGAIFGALRRGMPWRAALLISSALYAILHFFERPPAPANVDWIAGLVSFAQMLRGFTEMDRLMPAFFTLLLAGCILAIGYQRTGALYFSLGLHAGWIFSIKSYGFFTREQSNANARLWGSGNLLDGWLALVVLLLVLAVVLKWPAWCPARSMSQPEPVSSAPHG